jgi:hypothetical protein
VVDTLCLHERREFSTLVGEPLEEVSHRRLDGKFMGRGASPTLAHSPANPKDIVSRSLHVRRDGLAAEIDKLRDRGIESLFIAPSVLSALSLKKTASELVLCRGSGIQTGLTGSGIGTLLRTVTEV